jgi:membrane protease YdiL (CAAX protease family)
MRTNDMLETMVKDATAPRWHIWLAVLLVAPAPTVGAFWAFVIEPGPTGQAVFAACKAWLYLLPIPLWWFWLRFGARTRPRLTADDWRWPIGAGLLIGGAILAAYHLLLKESASLERVRELAAVNGINTVGGYLAIAAYITLINALLEEYVFRWFIQGQLRRQLAAPAAVLLSAAIFTAHHIVILSAQFDPAFAALGSAGVFAGGLLWGWCFEKSGSIWPAYVSHAIVDAALMLVGWWIIQPT